MAGAAVRVVSALNGLDLSTSSDNRGDFLLTNLPYQHYRLEVGGRGFRTFARSLDLRSNLPVSVRVELELEVVSREVEVAEGAGPGMLDTEASGTRANLSGGAIDKLPLPPSARGLEAALLSIPGFAANANGAIHPRGAHNQMTYVVDGMPISDQFSGQFATSIDPGLVRTLELFTGNVPPEYGAKVSGVAKVTTKSGFDGDGRPFGQAEIAGGGFDALGQSLQAGGVRGRLGWLASASGLKTNRFLDSPSLDNLHNGGNAQRAFTRLDWHGSHKQLLRLSAMAGRSSFQLANLRSQHAGGQRQRRLLGDLSVSFGFVRVLAAAATFDSTTSYRGTQARLTPSAGDTPVTAELARTLGTLSSLNRLNWRRGAHNLQAGMDAQLFPLRESFSFGLTDPGANRPGSPGFNPNLVPHDLSRGGARFRFAGRATGRLMTWFVRDRLRWRGLALDLGLRQDYYSLLVRAKALQPRLGLAYHLRRTGTVFRASFNRNFQTPPNENLLLSNAAQSAALAPPDVRRTLDGGVIPIRPQRQSVYEAGFQQDLGGLAQLDAVYYRKRSADLQDNDNFLNTGIIFPTSLASSRVSGFEARLVVPEARKASGSVALTHYRAIVTPPFTGGLFLGSSALDILSEGPFIIDHDQSLGVSGNLVLRPRRRWWMSWQIRHDSGLVSNPSDPREVASDPDYADLLPFVNLSSEPPRVRPRTVADAALGFEGYRGARRRWEAVLQVSNLTNRRGLYNFQSVFVGTRVIQPIAASLRLRWFW